MSAKRGEELIKNKEYKYFKSLHTAKLFYAIPGSVWTRFTTVLTNTYKFSPEIQGDLNLVPLTGGTQTYISEFVTETPDEQSTMIKFEYGRFSFRVNGDFLAPKIDVAFAYSRINLQFRSWVEYQTKGWWWGKKKVSINHHTIINNQQGKDVETYFQNEALTKFKTEFKSMIDQEKVVYSIATSPASDTAIVAQMRDVGVGQTRALPPIPPWVYWKVAKFLMTRILFMVFKQREVKVAKKIVKGVVFSNYRETSKANMYERIDEENFEGFLTMMLPQYGLDWSTKNKIINEVSRDGGSTIELYTNNENGIATVKRIVAVMDQETRKVDVATSSLRVDYVISSVTQPKYKKQFLKDVSVETYYQSKAAEEFKKKFPTPDSKPITEDF